MSSPSLRVKLAIVGLLYFSEGIPFGFVNNALSVYFRTYRMPLEQIGLLSLIGIGWSLKLLWAPLVDRYGRRFHWIVPSQVLLSAAIIGISMMDPSHPGALLWLLVGIVVLASATQDIAVDAYTIDLLESAELGMANGVRITSYRIALIGAGGAFVALSDQLGWQTCFGILAGFVLALGLVVVVWKPCHLPRKECAGRHLPLGTQWVEPLRHFFRLRHFWAAVLFILLFKIGDRFMGSMVYPFWVDAGFSRTQIGLVSGTLGTVASILGGMSGGWLTSHWGIGKSIIVLGSLQAIPNLGYSLAALSGAPVAMVYSTSIAESFTGGLGTAAFLAFLMNICQKRYSATQYAFLSTLFAFSGSIAGWLGGYAARSFGYPLFFFISFLGCLPAFAFLPWILKMARNRHFAGEPKVSKWE